MHTPLQQKLAQKGISASKLVELSGTSRADVSHYVHGRLERIGKKRRSLITEALCDLGILEKEEMQKPPVCRVCGAEYPTGKR